MLSIDKNGFARFPLPISNFYIIMKKQIQPYSRLNIFIHTNGATYNDSLYSIHMWKPLLSADITDITDITDISQKNFSSKLLQPTSSTHNRIPFSIPSSNLFLSSLNKFIHPKNSHFFLKKKHQRKLESLLNSSSNFHLGSSNLLEFNNILNKRFFVNFLSVPATSIYSFGSSLNDDSTVLKDSKSNFSASNCLLHKIIACNKTNLFNYLNLYSTHFTKIKALEMDTFSNPLWNINKDTRFGTFEQVSDNPLSKFKKRYSI